MFDPKKLFEMLKNAGEMQKNMAEKLKARKASGESAAGMVKVEMNGQFELLSLHIDESLLSDKAMLEDLIKAAINDATKQLISTMTDDFKNIASLIGF